MLDCQIQGGQIISDRNGGGRSTEHIIIWNFWFDFLTWIYLQPRGVARAPFSLMTTSLSNICLISPVDILLHDGRSLWWRIYNLGKKSTEEIRLELIITESHDSFSIFSHITDGPGSVTNLSNNCLNPSRSVFIFSWFSLDALWMRLFNSRFMELRASWFVFRRNS